MNSSFPVLLVLILFDTEMVSKTLITEEFWKGLPPIVGSWIGGSTSQLVLKEIVTCPENVFLTILILDNILVNIWTILMFQTIKRSERLNKWLRISKLYQFCFKNTQIKYSRSYSLFLQRNIA